MVFAPQPDPVDPGARMTYRGSGLDHLDPDVAPLEVLRAWYTDATRDHRISEAAAMVVATVDRDGLPNARTVLLKRLDASGLVFYTNTESTKADELAARPVAAAVLPWHPMFRQVRARGRVEPVSRADAEAYFQSRPRDSQIAAWASAQSRPLAHRDELVQAVHSMEQRFAGQHVLPLPPFWGGYLLRPVEIELWVGMESRLHDRWAWVAVDDSAGGVPAALDQAHQWRVQRRQP
ncbi:MAG: pyridoxamine 5'-phosphate oxidase [Actinomycetales bacterium]